MFAAQLTLSEGSSRIAAMRCFTKLLFDESELAGRTPAAPPSWNTFRTYNQTFVNCRHKTITVESNCDVEKKPNPRRTICIISPLRQQELCWRHCCRRFRPRRKPNCAK